MLQNQSTDPSAVSNMLTQTTKTMSWKMLKRSVAADLVISLYIGDAFDMHGHVPL